MQEESNSKTGKSIQSVARALTIMQYIAGTGNSVSLSSISRGMELSKSTVHGLISTLEKMGFVTQNQITGAYSLGMKLFELGRVVYESMDLRTVALSVLHELGKEHDETVHLAVLSDGEVVYIDKVDSSRSIGAISHVGGRNPAHCTGVGKAILAGLSEGEISRLIANKGLRQFTKKTITDSDVLKSHLELIRQRGYALDEEEIEEGLCCVAAPIKDHIGDTIAAVSISGPKARMTPQRISSIVQSVVDAAKIISTRLGYQGQRR